jgi:hypothetical protein
MTKLADVKQGDTVRKAGAWSEWDATDEKGHVLAVLPVPGRAWPDIVVVLPGGEVATWRRWGFVADDA